MKILKITLALIMMLIIIGHASAVYVELWGDRAAIVNGTITFRPDRYHKTLLVLFGSKGGMNIRLNGSEGDYVHIEFKGGVEGNAVRGGYLIYHVINTSSIPGLPFKQFEIRIPFKAIEVLEGCGDNIGHFRFTGDELIKVYGDGYIHLCASSASPNPWTEPREWWTVNFTINVHVKSTPSGTTTLEIYDGKKRVTIIDGRDNSTIDIPGITEKAGNVLIMCYYPKKIGVEVENAKDIYVNGKGIPINIGFATVVAALMGLTIVLAKRKADEKRFL